MKETLEPNEIVLQLTKSFAGLAVTDSFGEIPIFCNPEKKRPRGTYFCTIKLQDGPNDKASALDRDEVFRVSFALPKDVYQEQFGPLRPEEIWQVSAATLQRSIGSLLIQFMLGCAGCKFFLPLQQNSNNCSHL